MTTFWKRVAWSAFALLALLVLATLALRVGGAWYLQSDGFRKQITGSVDRLLKADGTFLPLRLADDTFYSDGFVARGRAAAFFSELRADQIRAVVNWRGLLAHRWQIDELHVQNLDLRFAEHTVTEEKPTDSGPHALTKKSWKLDLRKAEVAQSAWRWGETAATAGSITQSAFTLTPDEGAWLIEARSGLVAQTGWPGVRIEFAKLRYTGDSLFVTESALRTGAGRIAIDGEIKFDRAADLQARFDQLEIAPLLPPDWRARLHGNLAGTAKVHLPLPAGNLEMEGTLQLVNGQLEALPLLDQIATFTRTERFRRIALTRGSLSFTRAADLITARDVILESEGLMRVEGACTIANDRIDGRFQVGVTAASLQWLPGAQARVFTAAHDGYFWTPVRLTGPVSHPNEDLSRRLVAAAAGQLLDQSSDALQDAAKTLLDLIPR